METTALIYHRAVVRLLAARERYNDECACLGRLAARLAVTPGRPLLRESDTERVREAKADLYEARTVAKELRTHLPDRRLTAAPL